MPIDKIEALLASLDARADRVAACESGRNFARTLRVVVSEIRLELGLKEPRPA